MGNCYVVYRALWKVRIFSILYLRKAKRQVAWKAKSCLDSIDFIKNNVISKLKENYSLLEEPSCTQKYVLKMRKKSQKLRKNELIRGAFDSAKNHKRQRRKRQSVTAKREKSQTPKFV